ncbi:DUF2490 domain-containing protein [Gloeobacter kilaueensis]|uniref:DUF2490 domain-containing protein n=1 Tax=Gloeobacter kilaueensis (strain ATCC BAA-2537 / CCAP 1431/1 / ULC 316 / JS1) TaxID=1183438 RepID=U5QN79_GLOK1|nr:DUF2490 domain-containing protein [Gloeobacter kilaueensis]AGY60371.1 hypothetical protein GKIL_4125 [Gloeobacter kilaueensis JS1]
MRWLWLTMVGVALAALPAQAQVQPGLVEDFQTWTRFGLRGRFAGTPHRWGVEVENRLRNGSREERQFLVRPFVTLGVSDRFSVNLGWAHFFTWPTQGNDIQVETRLFQDYIYTFPVERLSIGQRIRVEERWFEGASDVSLRVRYRLQFQHPLDAERRWLANLSDELFWNLNTPRNAPVGGYEQNRVIASIIHKLTPELSVEIGYQGNFNNRPAPRADQFDHDLLLYFTYDLAGR